MQYIHALQRIKNCPVCGTHFSDRPNKVYCGTNCKTLHNNGLARERRIEEKTITGGLMSNHSILASILDKSMQDSVTLDISALLALGFDGKAPSSKGLVNNVPCRMYGGIAISVDEAKKTVTIFKT